MKKNQTWRIDVCGRGEIGLVQQIWRPGQIWQREGILISRDWQPAAVAVRSLVISRGGSPTAEADTNDCNLQKKKERNLEGKNRFRRRKLSEVHL